MAKKLKNQTPLAEKQKTRSPTLRAQRAVSKHAASEHQLQHIAWHTIPLEELNPLLQRQFVVGQEIMLGASASEERRNCPRATATTTNNSLTFWTGR